MIRLALSVEGQTEEEFIKTVLAPHLLLKEIYVQPIVLGRAGNRRHAGGNVTIERLVREILTLPRSHDAVTTLVDHYGFRGKGQCTADRLEEGIRRGVEERIGPQGCRLKPCVQCHEFEALPFSDVDMFSRLPGIPKNTIRALGKVREKFRTPEEINDNFNTAPSRRIQNEIPHDRKLAHGPVIARATGLESIRRACPRFNDWLACLEAPPGQIQVV